MLYDEESRNKRALEYLRRKAREKTKHGCRSAVAGAAILWAIGIALTIVVWVFLR